MPLLRTSASEILDRFTDPSTLSELMAQQAHFRGLGGVNTAELNAWEASIPVLARVLSDAGLGAVPVLLEHQLPLISKRVDAVLAGTHPTTGEPSYVVIELKQWSSATSFEGNPELVDGPGLLGAPRSHPVLQVDDYRSYLTDFATVLAGHPERVHGAAFLHNAMSRADIAELDDLVTTTDSKLFTGAEIADFSEYLKSRLSPVCDPAPADELMSTSFAPSRQLLDHAAAEIQEREEFVLLDRQHDAVRLVLHQVKKAHQADSKRVIVVSGGPGTGKSVVALSLLGELARDGRRVMHATGSSAFTKSLRKIAGHRSTATQKLFLYFNSFQTAEKNMLDVLIPDEAHRIRETSTGRYTPAAQRAQNRPQLDELIDVARTPVLLLDENQVVRPGELGSLYEITRFAEEKGHEVVHVRLTEQFRCGGSLSYTRWVESILGLDADLDITGLPDDDLAETDSDPLPDIDFAELHNIQVRNLPPGEPPVLAPDSHVSVTVADSPEEMEEILRKKMSRGFSARIAAGFCWSWTKVKKGDQELVDDVRLGDWSRPWNSPAERRIKNAPPGFRWATGEGGFDQIGCIYTAQGFEFDWSGVIIGPDLVWRDGDFVTVRSANADPYLAKKDLSDHDFDVLIRHVYKVLLTRGMRGTVIYSPDRQTREILRDLLSEQAEAEVDQ